MKQQRVSMHIITYLYNVLEQSILFFPLICAVYFSYVVLKVTDISVDGTIVLGAAITAKLLSLKYNTVTTMIIAMLCGLLAGMIVALIQRKGSINDIIAGLLMSFMLYSINLNIMGKPHMMVMSADTIPMKLQQSGISNTKFVFLSAIAIMMVYICIVIMRSSVGLTLRAFGENKNLLQKLGFQAERYRMLGLGVSGSIASFCGSVMSQTYGYADVNMSFGMAITAIGALIIGMHITSKIPLLGRALSEHNIVAELLGCFIGIFCYFSITNLLVLFAVNPINFKLILAIIIICFLKLSKKSGNPNINTM